MASLVGHGCSFGDDGRVNDGGGFVGLKEGRERGGKKQEMGQKTRKAEKKAGLKRLPWPATNFLDFSQFEI